MSQPIKDSEFRHGAGKGDEPRPINREVFRANFDQIKGLGKVNGTPIKKKGARVTYKY
jgi:hypothetical protein